MQQQPQARPRFDAATLARAAKAMPCIPRSLDAPGWTDEGAERFADLVALVADGRLAGVTKATLVEIMIRGGMVRESAAEAARHAEEMNREVAALARRG